MQSQTQDLSATEALVTTRLYTLSLTVFNPHIVALLECWLDILLFFFLLGNALSTAHLQGRI
jgi:flagellar biosynthesis protein FliP